MVRTPSQRLTPPLENGDRQSSTYAATHLARCKGGNDHARGTGSPDRELIYIAVSVTNGCQYCIASYIAAARAKGMNDKVFGELMVIVATANATNRLANGYQIPVDEQFRI